MKAGDRVFHPNKPEWGLGQVIKEPVAGQVTVFFTGAGERKLSLDIAPLILAEGEQAVNKQLDHLLLPQSGRQKFRTLEESINDFLTKFPQGFNDPEYFKEERDYKIKGHEIAVENLDQTRLLELLAAGNHDEVCKRALKVVNATNLPFPNEKMALKDGLKSQEAQKAFSEKLCGLLYGNGHFDEAFDQFAAVLADINAAKWTIITDFLFLRFPDRHMFVKPTMVINAAEICAFDINYRTEPNWETYRLVLEFSDVLKNGIARLSPRDNIDVQSFMWCIRPGN